MGKQNILLRMAVAAATSVALAGAAHAAGTTAGEIVENTFTLDYEVGGNPQPQIDNDNPGERAEFTVDRKIDLITEWLDTTNVQVAPNSTGDADLTPQVNTTTFRVRNLGNDNQAYDLSVDDTGGDFTPDATRISYCIDLDLNNQCDAGETVNPYTPGDATLDIAPDQQIIVFVESDIPDTANDGEEVQIELVADTLQPTQYADTIDNDTGNTVPGATPAAPGSPEVTDNNGDDPNAAESVLLDTGDTDGGTADNAGDDGAVGFFEVLAPVIDATKSVAVFDTDPASDAACEALTAAAASAQYSVPGACVQYVISVSNTGTGVASNIDIDDRLPPEVTFVAASLTTNNATGFDLGGQVEADVLTEPAQGEVCDGTTNCLVNLAGVSLPAGANGQILIWARVQ